METFAERFKYARQQKTELSLSKVAEAIGVSPQAAWNYENRPDGGVAGELLFPLADVLGVNARWLATGIGEPTPSDGCSPESVKIERIARALSQVTDDRLHALSVLLGIKL